MKIKTVKFAMLRETKKFCNDRAECEIELGPKDKPEDAWAEAIAQCLTALDVNQQTTVQLDTGRRWDQLKAICADPQGAEAFKQFVAKEEQKLRNRSRMASPVDDSDYTDGY